MSREGIYLYGYLNQVQSSRRLEPECGRNPELIWLTGRLKPDFKTIADFRKDNGPAIFVGLHHAINNRGQEPRTVGTKPHFIGVFGNIGQHLGVCIERRINACNQNGCSATKQHDRREIEVPFFPKAHNFVEQRVSGAHQQRVCSEP
jgi:hypothetical protein